jgi:dihydropteroate synthase
VRKNKMSHEPCEHIHFVTGRLAQHALQRLVPRLAEQVGFEYSIDVLPITVAALMSPAWIAKHIRVPPAASRIVLPGYCGGDLEPLAAVVDVPLEVGPRDLRQLPAFFAREPVAADYGRYDIEIIAEINHCPRLSREDILCQAAALASGGADWIDVGCEPGDPWSEVGEVVRALREAGHRVSIDSLNPREIEPAVRAGAELVLSVNSSNRDAAVDWGVEVIAIPDDPETLAGLDQTVDMLAQSGVALRIDPILEPISFGFAASLARYLDVRQRYPDAEMMMGIGNLTELTDVDSAGVNTLLLGFCQELGIRSVLTTQVINWSRSSVRECDLARRLMYHSVQNKVLPKHLEARLVMLRDEEVVESPVEQIAQLARDIRDNNYRVFASGDAVHLVSRDLHLHDADPFAVMEQLRTSNPDGGPGGGLPKNLDAGHAFYLGYEMCKARTALTLGKTYQQDEALDWGLATRPETRHTRKAQPGGSRND